VAEADGSNLTSGEVTALAAVLLADLKVPTALADYAGDITVDANEMEGAAVTLPAMATDGDYVEFEAFGNFDDIAANWDATLKVRVGTIEIFNWITPSNINADSEWTLRGKLVRTAATTFKAVVQLKVVGYTDLASLDTGLYTSADFSTTQSLNVRIQTDNVSEGTVTCHSLTAEVRYV
jgi:hypothetical protein